MKAKRGRTGVLSDQPCKRCKRTKQMHYRCAANKSGLDAYCCECRISASLASRRRDPKIYEYYKAKQRAWWQSWREKNQAGDDDIEIDIPGEGNALWEALSMRRTDQREGEILCR